MPRVFKLTGLGVGSTVLKMGAMHEQICDQAFDAGHVYVRAGRGTLRHEGAGRLRRAGAVATVLAVEGGTSSVSTPPAAAPEAGAVGERVEYGSSTYRSFVPTNMAVGLEPGVSVELVTLRVCSPKLLVVVVGGVAG